MAGISYTLISGTDTALLYDSLLVVKKQKDYTKLEGRRKGNGFYCLALCSVIGSYLYTIDHSLPYIATIIIQTLGLVITFFMIEPPRHKSAAVGNPFKDIYKTIKYALHGHLTIGLIILFAAAFFASTKQIMWIQQPYYMVLGIPEVWYGALIALGYLSGGVASHVNHLIFDKLSHVKALLIIWLWAVLICIGASLFIGLHGIALLMFGGTFLYAAASPQVTGAINDRVGSERRATITSTASFLRELISIPLSLFIGWLVTIGNVQYGLFGIAGWLLLSGLLLILWSIKKLKNKNPHK